MGTVIRARLFFALTGQPSLCATRTKDYSPPADYTDFRTFILQSAAIPGSVNGMMNESFLATANSFLTELSNKRLLDSSPLNFSAIDYMGLSPASRNYYDRKIREFLTQKPCYDWWTQLYAKGITEFVVGLNVHGSRKTDGEFAITLDAKDRTRRRMELRLFDDAQLKKNRNPTESVRLHLRERTYLIVDFNTHIVYFVVPGNAYPSVRLRNVPDGLQTVDPITSDVVTPIAFLNDHGYAEATSLTVDFNPENLQRHKLFSAADLYDYYRGCFGRLRFSAEMSAEALNGLDHLVQFFLAEFPELQPTKKVAQK